MEPLRYGLVGTGGMGKGHVRTLEAFDGADLVAIADPHEPSRASALEVFGREIPAYADYHEMLDKETLDAVVVATPNCTHADVICDVLDSGRHVLGEKPMATTVEDCNRMIAKADDTGHIYQIGLELRYAPVWQRLRALLDEKRIGPVRQMWCKEFRGPWARKVEDWITQQDKSGGALVEKDCHHFDLFNWFADAVPTEVAAFGSRDLVYGADRFDIEPTVLDNAQVIVNYDSGCVATLMLCMYCTGYQHGLEIGVVGADGWIVAHQHGGRTDGMTVTFREKGETWDLQCALPPEIRKHSHGGAVYLEHQAFAANIREGKRPLTDGAVAWWSTLVPLAAERAVAERRIVKLAEYGAPPA